jgi:hypothetical protein
MFDGQLTALFSNLNADDNNNKQRSAQKGRLFSFFLFFRKSIGSFKNVRVYISTHTPHTHTTHTHGRPEPLVWVSARFFRLFWLAFN